MFDFIILFWSNIVIFAFFNVEPIFKEILIDWGSRARISTSFISKLGDELSSFYIVILRLVINSDLSIVSIS